ncbi:DNA repair protein RecO [Deinococcus yavapaiensis]|uniref:DNA repair protein RecO n=1 Tax=Deinococcus yavapaiensis KR-236 TaxID=694435 RepID=A0A318S6T9_9DEIO|nr:DNA repair protein RecO [Deinococcus yavapaiensis]PYE54484.1 DNA replication and repair protein RecO [Deinococcus yavapaiensis KR-236]
MASRSTNRSGIIIRRHVLPAGDVLLTLLTQQGKLRCIARSGVRGGNKSLINLFQHIALSVYATPNSDLPTVQQVALEGALPKLTDPERYGYAHLMAELADTLFQEGEHSEAAFELFAGALRGISHHADPEFVALVMSYKLLILAGFVPRASTCARCGSSDPRHPDPLSGHLVCAACAELAPLPNAVVRFLRDVPKQSVRLLMQAPVPAAQRLALWRALERFVTLHVGEVRSWRGLPHESRWGLSAGP